jgi:hypothetical protein
MPCCTPCCSAFSKKGRASYSETAEGEGVDTVFASVRK